jgi:hypothetical protein
MRAGWSQIPLNGSLNLTQLCGFQSNLGKKFNLQMNTYENRVKVASWNSKKWDYALECGILVTCQINHVIAVS